MDATELARWTRFASKGGIGKCTAVRDCVAEGAEDLMFLNDDVITVLMQMPDLEDVFLGYCEGVVGRFHGSDVRFHAKLKKPVITKRSSVSTPKSRAFNSPSPVVAISSPTSSEGGGHPGGLVSSSSFGSSQSTINGQATATRSVPDDGTLVPSLVASSSNSSVAESSVSTISYSSVPRSKESLELDGRSDDMTAAEIALVGASPQFVAQTVEPLAVPNKFRFSPKSAFPEPPSPAASTASSFQSTEGRASYGSERRGGDRMSAASDGEVGIGLSLLQNLVNGDGDWSSDSGHSSMTDSPTYEGHTETFTSVSNIAPSSSPQPRTSSSSSQPRTSSASQPRASSSRNASSPMSTNRSASTDDWEGAMDIYDDYRYSRFSGSSKMSSLSQASGPQRVPPVPNDFRPRSARTVSSDSQYSIRTQSSSMAPPPIPAHIPPESRTSIDQAAPKESHKSVQSDHSRLSTQTAASTSPPTSIRQSSLDVSKDRSQPLNLPPSPLLHTSFGSPQTSPEMSSAPFRSSSDTHSSSASVVTPILRKRSDGKDPPRLDTRRKRETIRGGIVVDDAQELSADVVTMSTTLLAARQRSPPSASSFESKDSTLASSTSASQSPMSSPLSLDTSSPNPPTSITSPSSGSSRPSPTSPPQPHLDFRRPQAGLTAGATRTSLFLPHPNAPKAPVSSAGPLYGRDTSALQQSFQKPPMGSVIHTIHQALTLRHGPNGIVRQTTIFGRFDQELAESMGPVPISFSTERLPSNPPSHMPAASPLSLPRRAATVAPVSINSSDRGGGDSSAEQAVSTGPAIPRANFFPKAGTARPRSRSFSGFDAASAGITLVKERSREEGSQPFLLPSGRAGRQTAAEQSSPLRSSVSSQPAPTSHSTPSTQPLSKSPVTPKSAIRPPLAPSPLSLPQNNRVATRPSVAIPGESNRLPKTQTASLPSSPSPPPPMDIPAANRRPNKLRKAASAAALGNERPFSSQAMSRPQLPRIVPPGDPLPLPSSSSAPPAQLLVQDGRTSISSRPKAGTREPSPLSTQRKGSLPESEPPISGDSRQHLSSSVTRNPSLRSKLSLPALRTRNIERASRQDDNASIESHRRDPSGDHETVQVEDMDFELIRPAIPQAASARNSQDSGFVVRDSPHANPDLALPRLDSPSVSISSGFASDQRSPSAFSDNSTFVAKSPDADSTSIEAHRQRELKWMSLMPAVPAAQARKNKKVKKLLFEGVPNSVRYLVWAHLTNSKAKEVPKVYSQLSQRGRAPIFSDVEPDVRRFFPDQPQLQSAEGPLLTLLRAYLTMVPDVRYQPGLTCIAGHLLLLSPEEDAFWIFVSVMDTHLRPYFSTNGMQMEVDASLFSKAVESNDALVAKKIFVDMGIAPSTICRRWFSSLFTGSLPIEILHRVWDIFLYEGVPFLFRVGLALVCCSRRSLLESTRDEAVLGLLFHVPPTSLPPTTEAFISLVFSMKMKDDDIRKQRVKMEAQAKRQTQMQSRAMSTLGPPSTSRPSTSISFPRN